MYVLLAMITSGAFGWLCGSAFGSPGLFISVPVGFVLGFLAVQADLRYPVLDRTTRVKRYVDALRFYLGRPLWPTNDNAWRPQAHLCDWTCKLWCLLTLHMRLAEEQKCRCCLSRNYTLIKEASSARRWDELSCHWWETVVDEGHSLP